MYKCFVSVLTCNKPQFHYYVSQYQHGDIQMTF